MKKIPYSLSLFSFLFLAIYALSYITSFEVGVASLGLVLALFLPGFLFNQVIGLNKRVPTISALGLAIPNSLLLSSFLFLLYKSHIAYSQIPFIVISLVTTALLALILLCQEKKSILKPTTQNLPVPLITLFVALLPFILFLVRSYFSPYLVDQDGQLYISIIKEVERLHADTSFLTGTRYIFTFAMLQIHYLTGLSFLVIIKFILPGAFWLSLSSLVVWINKKTSWLLLIPLASAALIGQVDRFKPEILAMFFVIPCILYFQLALQKKEDEIKYIIFGLIAAVIASRCHEFGSILLFSYLLALLILLVSRYSSWKKYLTWKNIILVALIILPYLIIFKIGTAALIIKQALLTFIPANTVFTFRIWFLNNYVALGVEQGWPGWTFILFYIFNGSLIILITAFALRHARKMKTGPLQIKYFLPIIIYAFCFLLLAEIFPHFGIYALPDRAWVELFFALSIITMQLLQKIPNPNKIILGLVAVHIVGGIFIATYLAANSGSLVSREEAPVIKVIKNEIPQNAIIFSQQDVNLTLVRTYGNRDFFPITLPESTLEELQEHKNSIQPIQTYVTELKKSDKLIDTSNIFASVERQVTTTTHVIDVSANGLVNSSELNINTSKEPLPSPLLENSEGNRPLYLLFSFTKTNGVLSKFNRASWSSTSQSQYRSLYASIEGPQVIFKDKGAILIKLF